MRYDAIIIGAGAEGLAAAVLLGQAGLRALVVERNADVGGRSTTREFHPGFRASPFVDELAAIPSELYWTLGLARRGVIFAPSGPSLAVWPNRLHRLPPHRESASPAGRLLERASTCRTAILARAADEASAGERKTILGRMFWHEKDWPGDAWTTRSLCDVVRADVSGPSAAAHIAAAALAGRAADPSVPGSALHVLLAGADNGRLIGGLDALGAALQAAAREVGVEFSLGLEATDIHRQGGMILGVGLGDGSRAESHCVISTLDLKRTFLNFFPWNALPKRVIRRVNAFRTGGASARMVFALDRPMRLPPGCGAGATIHIAPDFDRMIESYQAWRAGIVAEHLPISLRFVSDGDPTLAPAGAAVATATVGTVPFRLFDGGWTHEKRAMLRDRVVASVDAVLPGFAARIIASDVIVPPDIEDALGATDGDLLGGEIAGDQMLNSGLWPEHTAPRTPITGLYLAGSNLTVGAIATCAAGACAARAMLVDRRQGRLP